MISTTTKETTTAAATFGDLNALLPLQQENDSNFFQNFIEHQF